MTTKPMSDYRKQQMENKQSFDNLKTAYKTIAKKLGYRNVGKKMVKISSDLLIAIKLYQDTGNYIVVEKWVVKYKEFFKRAEDRQKRTHEPIYRHNQKHYSEWFKGLTQYWKTRAKNMGWSVIGKNNVGNEYYWEVARYDQMPLKDLPRCEYIKVCIELNKARKESYNRNRNKQRSQSNYSSYYRAANYSNVYSKELQEAIKEIKNFPEDKKIYRKWAMIFHPDKGGNVEDFKIFQNEYDLLKKSVR